MEKGSTEGQEAAKKPQADGAAPAFAPGQNSVTGEVHRRGPDRKPRQVSRLLLTRALVAAKQKNGEAPVSGAEDQALRLREIMGDPRLENRAHVLRLQEMIKATFDDAPDSGAGRTTVFLFPSEVEEERRRAAVGEGPPAGRQAPGTAPGPLAGMEEVEEPPG